MYCATTLNLNVRGEETCNDNFHASLTLHEIIQKKVTTPHQMSLGRGADTKPDNIQKVPLLLVRVRVSVRVRVRVFGWKLVRLQPHH